MSIFFLLVGLEIKREIISGELSRFKTAALPMFGAVGGMVFPALLYMVFNYGTPTASGWGIPMATDIAFAVGVVTMLGNRVNPALRIFLMALAIVDDIGAIIVIAIFYTTNLNLLALLIGLLPILLLIVGNRAGIRNLWFYTLMGIAVWVALLFSGIHATIAGVIVAFTIPVRTHINPSAFTTRTTELLQRFKSRYADKTDILGDDDAYSALEEIESNIGRVVPPLMRLEHKLEGPVGYFIMPIFALANAGVVLGAETLGLFGEPVTLGVMAGLLIGKPLGITFLAWIACRLHIAELPNRVTIYQLFKVSILAGIGFTMSLFINHLAFSDPIMIEEAKIGILTASVLSALIGYFLFVAAGKKSAGTV
jgi:NhaA family Na+:H+ antiporter